MTAVESVLQQQMHTLYDLHHRWLQNWLRCKLGCSHRAADLAQDTFVRILSAQRKAQVGLPTEPGLALEDLREPRAYLTRVASRVLFNHYRRLSLEQAWQEALAQQPELLVSSPEERLIILQTLHEIDALLDSLPPLVRTTFLLSQLDGLTYAEIAEQLNLSLRTIKRYMAQAFEECLLLIE